LCYTRRSGERRREQGLAIEQSAQGQESLHGQAWRWRIVHEAARDGIEHPRGKSQLQAILEFND
jgi:hypothetical protein